MLCNLRDRPTTISYNPQWKQKRITNLLKQSNSYLSAISIDQWLPPNREEKKKKRKEIKFCTTIISFLVFHHFLVYTYPCSYILHDDRIHLYKKKKYYTRKRKNTNTKRRTKEIIKIVVNYLKSHEITQQRCCG